MGAYVYLNTTSNNDSISSRCMYVTQARHTKMTTMHTSAAACQALQPILYTTSKSPFGQESNYTGPVNINIKDVSIVIPDHDTKCDWNSRSHL